MWRLIVDNIRAQIEHLTDEEKLDLIGALWESLRRNHPGLSAAEKALLDERVREALANPDEGREWDEVLADLERGL
jgi:putative addiction module component (TIGR02574 family)